MKHEVRNIGPIRSAVSLALVAFFLSYPGMGFMYVLSLFAPHPPATSFQWSILIVVPAFVAVIVGFFVGAGAIIYNIIARFGLRVSMHIESGELLNKAE